MVKIRRGHYVSTEGMKAETYDAIVRKMAAEGFSALAAYPRRTDSGNHLMVDEEGDIDAGPMIGHLPNPKELSVEDILGDVKTYQDGDYVLFKDLDESSFEQTVEGMEASGFKRGFPLSFDKTWNVLGIIDGEICTFQIGSPRWCGLKTKREAPKGLLDTGEEDESSADKARIRELERMLRTVTASHADLMNYVADRAVANDEIVALDFEWSKRIEERATDMADMYVYQSDNRSKV